MVYGMHQKKILVTGWEGMNQYNPILCEQVIPLPRNYSQVRLYSPSPLRRNIPFYLSPAEPNPAFESDGQKAARASI